MGRCAICDYSQSADSIYHDSLAVHHPVSNNRIVYSKELGKDVCIPCLEEHMAQHNFWASIDSTDDHAFLSSDENEEHSGYCGCTSIDTD